jgi:D-alanyl-D-alanine carboxypeptidase
MRRFSCVLALMVLGPSLARADNPIGPPPMDAAIMRISTIAVRERLSGQAAVGDVTGEERSAVFGTADRLAGRPHLADERWLWASVTKQVTAILVMQEVEAGRLSLDDTMAARLPGFAGTTGAQVTLRQLLQHTSGLPDPSETPVNADDIQSFYVEAGAAITDRARAVGFCAGPVRAEPGAGFQYNNCDYLVLGAILEMTTGSSYSDLIRDRIGTPLGLTSLVMAPDAAPSGGAAAIGYLDGDKPHPPINVATLGAAGALTGTAADLLELDRALIDGRLLSAASRSVLWKGDSALGYEALGVWAFPAPLAGCAAPVDLIERRGDFAGIQVRNVIAPALGRSVVVFVNDAKTDFGEIWQGRGLGFDLLSAAFCPAQ